MDSYSVQGVLQLPVLYCMTLNINIFEQTPAATEIVIVRHHSLPPPVKRAAYNYGV